MKKQNSTVILNFQTRLIKNYLAKGFYITEKGTNQLSLLTNDVMLKINLNNQLDTYYFMKKKQSNICRIKHHQIITYSERYAYYLQTRLL